MNNLINNINFYHSIIFFLLSISLAIIINRFEFLNISPIICLLLILSIGISHGALDNQKGKKLTQLYNIKNSYFFYLMYTIIVIGIITFWLLFPTISLIIFLIVASYHFGKEDTEFLIKNRNASNLILYFLKVSLIIIAPLMFHFTETINIFKLLLIQDENFYLFLDFIESNQILSFALLISLFVNTYYFINNFKILNILIFFDFFFVILRFFWKILQFFFFFFLKNFVKSQHSFKKTLITNNFEPLLWL